MYLNKVFIIGNLTRDPELKALPSGSKVCSFGVATNRIFKDKDSKRQEVDEYNKIKAFSKLAELAGQYLRKGQQVLVEGRIQTRSWETNGEKKSRTEIIADNIQFGNKGQGGVTKTGGTENQKSSIEEKENESSSDKIEYPSEEINPDDIPF
jgi:single-strand DNA-binding protein